MIGFNTQKVADKIGRLPIGKTSLGIIIALFVWQGFRHRDAHLKISVDKVNIEINGGEPTKDAPALPHPTNAIPNRLTP